MFERPPQLAIRPDLSPTRIGSARNGSQPATLRNIALVVGTVATASLIAVGLINEENDAKEKAENAGTEARESLDLALKGIDLPPTFITELQCISSRAAQACKSTAKTDEFEKTHCDADRLDQWEKSAGINKPIKGLSKNAQYLLAPWGVKPKFICDNKGEKKRLKIKMELTNSQNSVE